MFERVLNTPLLLQRLDSLDDVDTNAKNAK